MRYGIVKALIIIGFIVLGAAILYPTIKWYYVITEEQKALASVSKKEQNTITEAIENNIQDIRKIIGNKDWYLIAKDKEGKKPILDIRTSSEKYIFKIGFDELKTLVVRLNPGLTDFNELEKKYKNTQNLIKRYDEINYYKNMKKRVIKLGLDLAGGVHFVLGIDEDKLKEKISQIYQYDLDPEKIKREIRAANPGLNETVLESETNKRLDELKKKLHERLKISLKKEHPEYNEGTLEAETIKKAEELKKKVEDRFEEERKEGLDRALLKIANRIDQFGVAEPVIRKGPQNTIVVELAGEKDKESAKEVITKVGHLTLQLVDEEFVKNIDFSKKDKSGYVVDRDYIADITKSKALPDTTSMYWVQERDRFGMPKNIGVLPLLKKIELDGERIIDAGIAFDQTGEVHISFELDSEGADIFAKVTKENIKKRLAIVLDDKIQSAPAIQGEIPSGKAQITGNFSMEEAKTLATILRSGSLPLPLKIEEERVVGPSLGLDQIDRGVKSSFIALILVSLFMIMYYKWSGINANFAQLLNLFFTFTILAQLGGTLSLSGIVGVVLTIGMNVDANVLINERIKEELRNGRSIESAVLHGYQRAFSAIFDGHLTTIMIGIILTTIGSGSIKGFGITLIIGLVSNLFTAVFVTHFIYDYFVFKFRIKKISI